MLQLLAIPYAVRVLGLATFGEYAAAVALFNWGAILEAGIGTSLVRRMVVTLPKKNVQETTSILVTGCFILTLLVVVAAGGAAILWRISAAPASGSSVGTHMSNLYLCSGALAGLKLIASVAQRARSAFQQTHVNNLYNGAANCVSALLLWIGAGGHATAYTLLFAMTIPSVVAYVCNGIGLWLGNPLVRGKWTVDWPTAKEMVLESGWLGLSQGGVFLERQAPLLVLTSLGTAALVGRYACAMQVLVIIAGMVVIVSTPLMPAVAEAIHTGDHGWWRRRVRLLEISIFCLGVVAVAAMWIAGPVVMRTLFGEGAQFDGVSCAGLAAWTTMLLASNCHYTVMVAAGKFRPIGSLLILQGGLFLISFYLLFRVVSFGGIFWLGAFLTLACTYLPWRRQVRILGT